MQYEVVFLEEKKVVGFCKRTGNDENNVSQIIGSLWQKWTKAGNHLKAGQKYIGLYSDYKNEKYDVTVGYEVHNEKEIPENMVKKTIPKGKYAKFVLIGDVVTAVQRAWKEIWCMNLERTFLADFEEYQEGENKDEMEIHIYIAIK